MKTNLIRLCILGFTVWVAGCSGTKEPYLDLSTGETVEIEKDEKTGAVINKDTGEPLYIYVDTRTGDTIYAKTGAVVNGHIVQKGDKYYFEDDVKLKLEDDGSVEYKDDDRDYKVKIDEDGDYKKKDGDRKVKIDGETGEKKVKND